MKIESFNLILDDTNNNVLVQVKITQEMASTIAFALQRNFVWKEIFKV